MTLGPWTGNLYRWTRRCLHPDGSPGPVAARIQRRCEGYVVRVGRVREVVPHGPNITVRAKATADGLLRREP